MTKREYTADALTVLWDSDLCTHCRACLEGLPEVFDLKKRPWVNMQGATPEAIRNQVLDCPSGALALKIEG
jgi:uncharacterized Fe-S cluster protein YjdI